MLNLKINNNKLTFQGQSLKNQINQPNQEAKLLITKSSKIETVTWNPLRLVSQYKNQD